MNVVVYVGRLARGTTWGVARYATNLVRAFTSRRQFEVTVLGAASVIGAYEDLGEMSLVDEAEIDADRSSLGRDHDLLIQLHQFQRRVVGLPTVLVVHDLDVYDAAWSYSDGRRRRLVRALHKNLIRADAVVSHFPHVVERTVEVEPLAAGKTLLTVCPLPIDDVQLDGEAVASTRRRFGLDDGRPMILYPARLRPHKNHWNLLTAIHEIQRDGYDMRVICPGAAGPDGWGAVLGRRVKYLGLTGVHFPGFVTSRDLQGLYELATAAILPSQVEGGAYVAQEALAFDRAFASSAAPGILAHLARMQLDVPTFDPFDLDRVAAVLKRVVDDPDTIVAGYERANQMVADWTWDRLVEEIVSSIEVAGG